jgi:cytochrome P450
MWSALRANPDQLPNFVDEGLRFVNPVLGLPRVATKDVELGGVTIPKGGQVLLSFCAANRDERMTPHADQFIPTRAGAARHLGFGRGIHYCVGARMAKNMMTIAIEVLLERLPGLRLQQGYEPEHTVHPFLWGLSRLPLEWAVTAR